MSTVKKQSVFRHWLEVGSRSPGGTLIACLALAFCAIPCYAQYKLCFPRTTWFGSASGPNLGSFQVADPGWLGAFRYVWGDGTSSQYAVVQGIKDSSNNLFLSFEAEGLTSLDSTTIVVLALDFRQSSSDTGPLWKIVLHPVFSPPANPPSTSASAVGVPSGTRSLYIGTTNGAGQATWTQVATPAWLAPTPPDPPNNVVGYWGTSGNYNWFMETEIPSANLPVPTTEFGLYINIFRVVGTQYQESWWPPVNGLYEPGCIPGTSVGGCTPAGQTPDPGIVGPTAYNWGRSTIDPAPAQPCGGVSVSSIFTNNFPNSRICLVANQTTSDGTVCAANPNIFTANVHNTTVNGSGVFQPAPNVQATFSIANFGLHPTWDGSQWTKINVTNNPALSPTDPACPGPTNRCLLPNSTTALKTNSWFPVQPNASLYDPVSGHPHQCVMVTLDSTTGNVDFINNMAVQNMDFVTASKFQRTAEISAKGYPPRYNPDGTQSSDQVFDLHLIINQEILSQGQGTAANYPAGAQRGQTKATERGKVISQLTWIAQGCRHTGRFMVVDERKIELCDPVGGFGYVMRHTGASAVKDWKVKFTGSGLQPVPGQENTYQIHIPQDGVANVTTYANPKEQGTGKFAVFFDAGAGIPHGTFGSAFNTGFSLNAGLEYIATSYFSAEGIFGYHHFPGAIAGDLNLYQFSVNGKTYLTSGTLRPFVNGGIGAYKFSPGPTKFCGNVGAGVLYNITSRFGLQGSYNFHIVNTPGEATKFSTIQGGIRFVF